MSVPNLVPPSELAAFVGGDFEAVGEHFLRTFIDQAGLLPHHRVLDVGCGAGRIAAPLTGYLKPPGSYDGFDIVDVGIDWCRRNITPRFPHFRFQLADVFSRGYNPGGRSLACDYTFPFPDGAFDFVCATSVFTHMLPDDMENYLAEIARVLAPGGHFLATFFLHNAEVEGLMAAGKSGFRFQRQGSYWTVNRRVPEDAIAYEEEQVAKRFKSLGLRLEGGIRYGNWSGRANAPGGHDVLIATRLAGVVAQPRRRRRGRFFLEARRSVNRLLYRYVWRSAVDESVVRARRRGA